MWSMPLVVKKSSIRLCNMVIKAKADWFCENLGRVPGEYWLTNWADGKAHLNVNFYPLGKVTFSLKIGKRWRLIAGRIDFEPESHRDGHHHNQHYCRD